MGTKQEEEVLRVIRVAVQLLQMRNAWTRDGHIQTMDEHEVKIDSPRAYKFSLEGALQRSVFLLKVNPELYEETRAFVCKHGPWQMRIQYYLFGPSGLLKSWNRCDSRTQDEVIDFLKTVYRRVRRTMHIDTSYDHLHFLAANDG